MNSHHGAFNALSPSNQYQGRERGSSGYHHSHNFHPLQNEQQNQSIDQKNTNTGHSIVHGSSHYHGLNVRDRDNQGNSGNLAGNSIDNMNLMASNESSLNALASGSNNQQNNQNQNNVLGGQQASGSQQDNGGSGSPQPG